MNKYFLYPIFLTLYVFLFIACNNHKGDDWRNKNNNETEEAVKKNILGKWGGLGETAPVWDIGRDSIFYFQHSRAYAYKIVNNNMVVNFENLPTTLRNIRVVNDTLFFIDDAGLLIKGYRFR